MADAAPEIKVKLTAEDTGVAAAIKELGAQLKTLKKQEDETAQSARNMGEGHKVAAAEMHEARGAAKLLSEELGIGLNRHLAGVLASSEALGPLLSAAFPIAAAIGFFEVIKQGAEKFSELIADTFIFTEEMKEAYKHQVEVNTEIDKSVKHTKTLKDDFELIGLTGVQKDIVLLRRLSDQISATQEEYTDLRNKMFIHKYDTGDTESPEYQKEEADAGAAHAKLDELNQESFNLEKDLLIEDQKEKDAAAAKTVALAIKEQERQEAAFHKQTSALEKSLQDDLALYKESEKQREQTDKGFYDRGLLSLDAYFAQRRKDLDSEKAKELALIQAQIDAAQKEADAAGDDARKDKVKSQQSGGATTELGGQWDAAAQRNFLLQQEMIEKITDLKSKQQLTELEFQTKVDALETEQFKETEENQQKIDAFDKKRAQSEGQRLAAVKAELDTETKQYQLALLKQGTDSPAQIDAKVAGFRKQIEAQAEFEQAERKTQEDILAFETKKRGIELELKNGLITRQEAEKQINALIRARLPLLQQDAAAEATAAASTNDQANIAKSQEAAQNITNLSESTNALQKQLSGELTNDFESFFSNITKGTESVGNAFRSLAASIFQSFAKLAEQQIFKQLFGDPKDGGGGGGGILSGGLNKLTSVLTGGKGQASASPQLSAAATQLQTAGASLQSAASALQASAGASGGGGLGDAGGGDDGDSSGAGGIFGTLLSMLPAAEGGLISGPGGPKSDSIPARLSDGEYVVKADAVSAFGVHNLEAINRGLKIPSLSHLALPKFADGGLVGTAGMSSGGDSNINLGIGLDEGLILKHLSSKAAGNIVLQHLTNNPKAAAKALSRST
jgi:hypothetical protein